MVDVKLIQIALQLLYIIGKAAQSLTFRQQLDQIPLPHCGRVSIFLWSFFLWRFFQYSQFKRSLETVNRLDTGLGEIVGLLPMNVPRSHVTRTRARLAAVFLRCAPDVFFLDQAEHLFHNRDASVATLRQLFAFGPECRSRSLRNQRSPSPESPRTGGASLLRRNG